MSNVDYLYQAILALPETERYELLDRLSVPAAPTSSIFSETWRAEIARRYAALKAGTMGTRPWEEVRDEVTQRYSKHA